MRNIDDLPAEKRAELAKVGAPLGLNGQEVLAASELGMSPARYAAFKNRRSIEDMQEATDQLAAREKACADAEHALEVERQKAALQSA